MSEVIQLPKRSIIDRKVNLKVLKIFSFNKSDLTALSQLINIIITHLSLNGQPKPTRYSFFTVLQLVNSRFDPNVNFSYRPESARD